MEKWCGICVCPWNRHDRVKDMDATWGKGETGPSSSSGGGGQGPVSTQPTSSASGATGRLTMVEFRGCPDPPNFWNTKNKWVFNNRKVCVSCSGQCPMTPAPSAAHLTVFWYLCSSGSNARGESEALEGYCVSSKGPSRVRDRDKGAAGGGERKGKEFPGEG